MRTLMTLMVLAVLALTLTGCNGTDIFKEQPESWKTEEFAKVKLVDYPEFDDLADVWVVGSRDCALKTLTGSRESKQGRYIRGFLVVGKQGTRRYPPQVKGSVDRADYRIGTVHLVDKKGVEFTSTFLPDGYRQ